MFNITVHTSPTVLSDTGLAQAELDQIVANIELAAELWGRYINAPSSNIDLELNFSNLPGSTLAQAGTSFSGPPGGVLQASTINEFNNPDNGNPDTEAFMTIDLPAILNGNFFYSSNLDFIQNPGAPGQVDFLSLIVHELGHSLGFLNANSFTTSYGQFVSGEFFTGPNAVAANGGMPVELADDTHFEGDDLLSPSIFTNLRETITAVHIGVLQDIGAPVVQASAASDTIYGFHLSNDTVSGLGGSDTLFGLTGDDTLVGGAGGDALNGGEGTDTASYAGSNAGVTIFLEDGTTVNGDAAGDTFISIENLAGSSHADFLFGDAGRNQIDGEDGADWLYGRGDNDTINGGAGADLLFGEAGADTIYGGDDGDFIFGGTGSDTLYGNGGIDWLRGEEGLDILFGNAGDDILIGGTGNDQLTGGTGTDTFFGEADDDIINGEANGDVAFGQDGDDIINGGSEGDFLFGGTGADTINGGTENDLLWGNAPNEADGARDTFVFNSNWGFDAIYDFELGIDQIRLEGVSGLTQFSDFTVLDGGSSVTLAFGSDAFTLSGISLGELNANTSDFVFIAGA